MWEIRQERAEDAPLVEALNAAAFGPGRYAKSAYRLREGVAQEASLAFVAVEDGVLRGSVRFWPILVGNDPALLLGPLAVQSAQRGRGIGIDLMRKGIAAAKELGHAVIILVGDEPYYARVGFTRLPPGRLKFPGPVDASRVLGLSLKQGALVTLSGTVRRPRLDEAVCAQGAGMG
ncbi:MAG: GNAT family N-acetyltransferase [Alphaproteobacteria bacterium]|nr:GNAT family N-acetyltransferase [Alphaproteobacteria bacterium]